MEQDDWHTLEWYIIILHWHMHCHNYYKLYTVSIITMLHNYVVPQVVLNITSILKVDVLEGKWTVSISWTFSMDHAVYSNITHLFWLLF